MFDVDDLWFLCVVIVELLVQESKVVADIVLLHNK